jgi:hypothetical protein
MYIYPCGIEGQSSDCPLVTCTELDHNCSYIPRADPPIFPIVFIPVRAVTIEYAVHIVALVVAYTAIGLYLLTLLSLAIFIILRCLESLVTP